MSIIVDINTINPKSIDLSIVDDKFLVTDTITITKLIPASNPSDPPTPAPTPNTTVRKIFNEDFTKATIILANEAQLLELGFSYVVNLERDSVSIASVEFIYDQIISIESAKLTCHGTRFFTLTYDFPIYIEASEDPYDDQRTPIFLLPAALEIGVPNGHLIEARGYRWARSADVRSINIESTAKQTNTGNLIALSNFPVSSADPITGPNWIREFEYNKTTSDGPIIPMIKSEGVVPKVDRDQTIVESLTQLGDSKTEFIVKFNRGVLLLAQPGDILTKLSFTPNPASLTIANVRRPDNNAPDELIFTLSDELTSGNYDFIFESILDANGNPTKIFNTTITIDDTPPNVMSAVALLDGFTVDLSYDSDMIDVADITDPDYLLSALNPTNYEITLVSGIPYSGSVTSVALKKAFDSTSHDFTLTLSDPLSFSEYKITVSNVLSKVPRTPLDKDFAIFAYYDPLGPTVEIIGYNADGFLDPKAETFANSTQVVIASFTKPMKVGAVDGSADDYQNYGLNTPDPAIKFSFLEEGTIITNVSTPVPEYAQRFRLPLKPVSSNFDDVLMSELGIAVGYHERINNVYQDRYVESISGSSVEVIPFGNNITKWATPITFCDDGNNKAKMSLIIPNQIAYSIDATVNPNEFYSVDASKLTFTFSNGIPTPEVVKLAGNPVITGNQILFTFERDLNLDALTVTVTESVKGSIVDIFGKPVLIYDDGCEFDLLRDKVKPIIKAASLVAIDDRNTETSNPIKVALFFNKRMKYTADDNFIAYDDVYNQLQVPKSRVLSTSPDFITKKIPNPPFTSDYRYLPAEADLSIIEISGSVSKFLNSSNANLKVQTNLDESQMDTEDVDGNIVEPPFTKDIVNFKTKSFGIKLLDSDASPVSTNVDAEFKLSFDRILNTTWFSKFNFGTADAEGKYAFEADITASYINDDAVSTPIDSATLVPANSLVTQIFKLYVEKPLDTPMPGTIIDHTDEAADLKSVGTVYDNILNAGSAHTGLITAATPYDPATPDTPGTYTVDFTDIKYYAATITIEYYTISETTIDVATKVAEVYFTPDSKALVMLVKETATKEFVSTKIAIATTYCEPVPYVLMAGDDMVFANVSYKAKSLKPVIEYTPL